MLDDVMGFTGQHGFIGCAVSGQDNAVSRDLIAAVENHPVALHQRLRAEQDFLSVPNAGDLGGLHQLQTLDGPSRTQLLHRADDRVGDHDAQKEHIAVAVDRDKAQGQGNIEKVEECKQIGCKNVQDGAGGRVFCAVALSGLFPGCRLSRRKALLRRRLEITGCAGWNDEGFRGMCVEAFQWCLSSVCG